MRKVCLVVFGEDWPTFFSSAVIIWAKGFAIIDFLLSLLLPPPPFSKRGGEGGISFIESPVVAVVDLFIFARTLASASARLEGEEREGLIEVAAALPVTQFPPPLTTEIFAVEEEEGRFFTAEEDAVAESLTTLDADAATVDRAARLLVRAAEEGAAFDTVEELETPNLLGVTRLDVDVDTLLVVAVVTVFFLAEDIGVTMALDRGDGTGTGAFALALTDDDREAAVGVENLPG